MGFYYLQIQQISCNLGHQLKHFTLLTIKPAQAGTQTNNAKWLRHKQLLCGAGGDELQGNLCDRLDKINHLAAPESFAFSL